MKDNRVAKAAAVYRRDLAKTALSRAALYDAIRAALREGEIQADIARTSGFTRETIKKIQSQKEAGPE